LVPNSQLAGGNRRGNKLFVVMVVTMVVLFTVNILPRILNRNAANWDVREWEKLRREWERERHEYLRERSAWQAEREEHQLEREEWDRERLAWEAEREDWNAERSERRKKEMSRLHWQQPQPAAQCSSYGTREYSARLWGNDWISLCRQVPINIHGKAFEAPDFYEDKVNNCFNYTPGEK
jgi:hypothetical protein